jgi:hypothetical protein
MEKISSIFSLCREKRFSLYREKSFSIYRENFKFLFFLIFIIIFYGEIYFSNNLGITVGNTYHVVDTWDKKKKKSDVDPNKTVHITTVKKNLLQGFYYNFDLPRE